MINAVKGHVLVALCSLICSTQRTTESESNKGPPHLLSAPPRLSFIHSLRNKGLNLKNTREKHSPSPMSLWLRGSLTSAKQKVDLLFFFLPSWHFRIPGEKNK